MHERGVPRNCKEFISIIQQPKKKRETQTNKTHNQGILFLDRKWTTSLKFVSLIHYSQLFICYNFLFLYLLLAFYMRSLFKFLYSLSNCQYICGMFLFVFVMESFTWPMYSYHRRLWMNVWLLIIQYGSCIENMWLM